MGEFQALMAQNQSAVPNETPAQTNNNTQERPTTTQENTAAATVLPIQETVNKDAPANSNDSLKVEAGNWNDIIPATPQVHSKETANENIDPTRTVTTQKMKDPSHNGNGKANGPITRKLFNGSRAKGSNVHTKFTTSHQLVSSIAKTRAGLKKQQQDATRSTAE